MYPIVSSWKKGLTSFLILWVFGYLMIAASSFYVTPDPVQVADIFLMQDDQYASHVLELNQVWLVPVDATDAVTKYVVQPGDSLSLIASQFGTTIEQIQQTNDLANSVLRVWQELFITETDGIIYYAKEDSNYLIFANKYNLDLEDLMTLNYVVTEDSPIAEWDEMFLPITMEKAYALWLEERPAPVPQPVLVQQSRPNPVNATPDTSPAPAPTPITSSVTAPVVTESASTASESESLWSTANTPYAGKVIATWWDGSTQVNNGFYKWYCTYWAAKRRPDIFPYTSETTQSRPFGGNAAQWLTNAQRAWLSTWNTPAINAIAVFGGGYGHVGVIIKVDRERRLFLMEEMNGPSGKFYVNHRWVSMDRGDLLGYIY